MFILYVILNKIFDKFVLIILKLLKIVIIFRMKFLKFIHLI